MTGKMVDGLKEWMVNNDEEDLEKKINNAIKQRKKINALSNYVAEFERMAKNKTDENVIR